MAKEMDITLWDIDIAQIIQMCERLDELDRIRSEDSPRAMLKYRCRKILWLTEESNINDLI